jgi:hypothetical protein
VKPAVIVVLILATALTVLMIIWVSPVVGLQNSSCERYPYTSGCR